MSNHFLLWVFYTCISNCRIIIEELLASQLYSVDMNISVCFETGQACDQVLVILQGTPLPTVPCNWSEGFIHKGTTTINIILRLVLRPLLQQTENGLIVTPNYVEKQVWGT